MSVARIGGAAGRAQNCTTNGCISGHSRIKKTQRRSRNSPRYYGGVKTGVNTYTQNFSMYSYLSAHFHPESLHLRLKVPGRPFRLGRG